MKIRLFTIPNMLTLSNLLCGTFALVSALKYGNLEWSFWFVVLAAVFDFFDGFVARLLGQSSRSACSSIRWPTSSRSVPCPPPCST